MAVKIITVYEATFCTSCRSTTIHEIFMSGTTDRRRVVVTKTCLCCMQAKGRVC